MTPTRPLDLGRAATRRLLVLLAVLALGLLPSAAAADDAPISTDDNNIAQAINLEDGASLFELAFSIREVTDGVVDQGNLAAAYSSCEDCRTVAIAIQVVLVFGDASTITPENVAVAINEGCTLCNSFASAYQIVIGTGGPVELTKDGEKRIKELQKELEKLQGDDLSNAELDVELDRIVAELRTVLDTELVPVEPDDGRGDRDKAKEDSGVERSDKAQDAATGTTGQATPEGESSDTGSGVTAPGDATTSGTTTESSGATTEPSRTTTEPTTATEPSGTTVEAPAGGTEPTTTASESGTATDAAESATSASATETEPAGTTAP